MLVGCSDMTRPEASIDGRYVLETVSGHGPASGSLILTRAGYAERRVRFREPSGILSREYLALGTAELRPDNSIDLQLRELDVRSEDMWAPSSRLVENGTVELRHPDPMGAADIVEIYRRR
jgi:hypothetical protein